MVPLGGEKMFWLSVTKENDIPLIRQVYDQIKHRILNGQLKGGERIPSSRELAANLCISRNVVLEAYEQLIAEGFIETKQGSGTFVGQGAFLEQDISSNVKTKINLTTSNDDQEIINFRSGIPALNLFPKKVWAQIAKEVYQNMEPQEIGYGNPEGTTQLRKVLSNYLLKTRGVYCSPDQILITSGATQALSILAKLLLKQNDTVIIEDPVTYEIQNIFSNQGSTLYPIPVDEKGMRTDLIPSNLKPSFVFVTPSHQFPLGGILPIQRRIELIQFARQTGCYIVEDDYDSEFRYNGPPISSLQGLDPEFVIYIGTFSKILSPGLRIGYLVLPQTLIERCRDIKWYADLHTSSFEQITLAKFIEEGHLERHITKMRRVYEKRRKTLIQALVSNFSDTISIHGDSTGLHLIVEFKNIDFSEELLNKVLSNNVRIYSVDTHSYHKGKHLNKIILGYGNVTTEKIIEGITKLKETLSS
jgi:GntR family transcriptional regulator/MocR family aminotransferase